MTLSVYCLFFRWEDNYLLLPQAALSEAHLELDSDSELHFHVNHEGVQQCAIEVLSFQC